MKFSGSQVNQWSMHCSKHGIVGRQETVVSRSADRWSFERFPPEIRPHKSGEIAGLCSTTQAGASGPTRKGRFPQVNATRLGAEDLRLAAVYWRLLSIHDCRINTAAIWSTTWPRRRIDISVSRNSRLASAEVNRSSQR